MLNFVPVTSFLGGEFGQSTGYTIKKSSKKPQASQKRKKQYAQLNKWPLEN